MKITDSIKKIKTQIIKIINRTKSHRKHDNIKLVGFRLLEVIILVSIATTIGVFSGSFLTYNLYKDVNETVDNKVNGDISKFQEVYQDIMDNYYEDVDTEKLIDAAINGMLSILDGYTSYMDAEETQMFNERMKGEYEGIGIEFITAQGYVHTITNVMDNSPALKAGVKKDDIIVRVDDIDASTKTGNEIAAYIKGKVSNNIQLTVNRGEEEIVLDITKSTVSLPSVTEKTFDKNSQKVGYIEISLFANNTYNQFKEALVSLENDGIKSLIIDVRDDSGGYLHIADNILELFLDKGDIMYKMQDKSGIIEYVDQSVEKRNYPVAVLINGNSASASEILAAAFKESYGAEIIGVPSYGKGTVQQPSDLINGGMVKVTTDKWLTPDGNWIDKIGVQPTIEIQISDAYYDNPIDENDAQLQKALEVLTK